MTIPATVVELVERFERNLDVYKQADYKEARVRVEFVDPFFEALGWDVRNVQGYAEQYKDVVHEDAIKVGGATQAPDYCFRIGGTRKFFLEVKKPAIRIKEDVGPAYQLRRYAWSAKLPLSILTDFEEFAVYDCRQRPKPTDKVSVGRVMYFTFDQYPDHLDEIHAVFARESVLKGSFDRYAEQATGKRGTAEVDTEFLKEIEGWRDALARNIALRNPGISVHELNFAIQRTIDRIIFLRICEDRGIEAYGRLMALTHPPAGSEPAGGSSSIYPRLHDLYRQAEEKYNSGIFDFQADSLTRSLTIDDKVLDPILADLYYPQSPYEFSVLPVDILGQVYEQFLGKVVRLTPAHRAVVEEKPEVKKAGGVYYTPTYIVDYIVQQTVGKLVEGKTPRQIAKLRVLDPACGSGSFLLGAYQYLLDYHRRWYEENDPAKYAKGKQPAVYQASSPTSQGGAGGGWRLTTAEKKRILLDHIYGVDIDRQAVEVTKLSLLLKVLEGESDESIGQQLSFFHERALPNLDDNIKCGNSLIGPDYFEAQLLPDEEEMRRVNPFDWEREFPKAMAAGGFDCVIGNPPYVDIKALPNVDVEYIFSIYSSANNRVNLFACFIEKSLSVVHPSRFRFSMIIPTALLTQESYRELRRMVIDNYQIAGVVRLPNELFGASAGDVKVDTAIVVFKEKDPTQTSVEIIGYSGYDRISKIDSSESQVYGHVEQATWMRSEDCVWSINTTEADLVMLRKCEQNSLPLVECAEFCLGLTPYDKYKGHTPAQIENRVFHANYQKDETFKKLLAGNDVMRYVICWNGEQWISYGPWLGAPRKQKFFTDKRILVKQIIDWTSKRIWASITDEELYNTQNAFNILPKSGWVHEYLLGILNSRLMTFYHRKKYLDEFKMRFQKILIRDCKQLPIRTINFDDPADVARHERMVSLVEQMLALHQKLAAASIPQDKTLYQRQIEATDRQIDALVYELYGLTEEEIAIVENA
jgi:hypothetical protein